MIMQGPHNAKWVLDRLLDEASQALNDCKRTSGMIPHVRGLFGGFFPQPLPLLPMAPGIVGGAVQLKLLKNRYLKTAVKRQYEIDAALKRECDASEARASYLDEINVALKSAVEMLLKL